LVRRVRGVIHPIAETAKDAKLIRGNSKLARDSEILPDQAVRLLDDLTRIVARACSAILEISPSVPAAIKADQSPVTAADVASETVILEALAKLLPKIPVVSEEKMSSQAAPVLDTSFFLVDPLDGTREFIAGRDEFTVNIAIVTGGTPILGIVAAPRRKQLWRGVVGARAEKMRLLGDNADEARPIRTRRWPTQSAIALVSRSHLDPASEAFVQRLEPVTRSASGSSIKFCQIAEGSADVYPRLATTCEWDIAAGHAVVAAAGGVVAGPDGGDLTFGHADKNFRVPGFVAWGDPLKATSPGT
jgi:3'(2'), 5'-bisphosphate nucleotidase